MQWFDHYELARGKGIMYCLCSILSEIKTMMNQSHTAVKDTDADE